jgi:hypothetical protein
MKTKKQKAILILKISSVLLIVSLVLLFLFRNTILNKVIHRIDDKFTREYQCHFTVKKAEFQGITNLEFQDISLVPIQADTLMYIKKLKTNVNFWKLLIGDIQLGKLEINNGFIQLLKNKNGSNFDAFLRSKKDKNDNNEVNYAKLLNRITSNLLDLVPTNLHVKGFSFKVDDLGNKIVFDFNQLSLYNKQLHSLIQVTSDVTSQKWSIKGFADPRDKKADLQFVNAENDRVIIPYLDKKFNLKIGFQSIHFNLENLEMKSGILHIDGYSSIQSLSVYHPKIAKQDVVIQNARFDYHWNVSKRSIALDSTSVVQLNKIKCAPFISYTNETDKIYALQLKLPKIKAQDFISSLPTGLFRHFEGMEAQGNFSYSLDFQYNNHQPNKLIFESRLQPEGIRIIKYGEANLSKINTEFTYKAVEKGIAQRSIFVGFSNPNYTPLNEISPYLQKCVLTSEDPSFFNHRGFINEAFKQSISKNIRTKKFARGASTISMQLVKNVFLTREKTLSRKLEEILLVYILENNRISTKERMLEVYFNIIEFGPNVYGIGEAAHFYFQKKPADLTLNECLFLASIIPKPKGFMYRFDADHQLKSFANQQHKFLTQLMLRRKLLTENDTIGQNEPLLILGEAQYLLKKKPTTIEHDSTSIDAFEF